MGVVQLNREKAQSWRLSLQPNPLPPCPCDSVTEPSQGRLGGTFCVIEAGSAGEHVHRFADRFDDAVTRGVERRFKILTQRHREFCGLDAEQVTRKLQIKVAPLYEKTAPATQSPEKEPELEQHIVAGRPSLGLPARSTVVRREDQDRKV